MIAASGVKMATLWAPAKSGTNGDYSQANAVNSSGKVVGFSSVPGNIEDHAFLWTRDAGMADLGTLGGDYGNAGAINDGDQVVGYSRIAPGSDVFHPFSWTQAGGMVDLGSFGGDWGAARAVNDRGQVVGWSYLAGNASYHAFSWTRAAGIVDLGTLGGDYSDAFAVNDRGQIVGLGSTVGNTASHATLWQPPVITVQIDIRPGSDPNNVNPRSRGVIPVAILSTAGFDASRVDPKTVRFGASGTEADAQHVTLEDTDGDGNSDLVLQFQTQSTGLKCGAILARLTGTTFDGQNIEGTDSVRTVGCK